MLRVVIPELLDSDAGTPAEIRGSLRDLRFINACFGGVRTTTSLIERVVCEAGKTSLSLLEVAAGTGFVPERTRIHLLRQGIMLNIMLLDRAPGHLNSTRPAVAGDALALPFRDDSFDVVSCSLFAHHLQPDQLITFMRESLRVCRLAVLINDLIRHPLHLAMVYAGFIFYRSRLTRHDAPASVRRSYTLGEMRDLLARTPAARVELSRHYLFRMGVIAWKEPSPGNNDS